MAAPQPNKQQQSGFLKGLQARVAADGETVGHVLDPNRTADTVQFPDPSVPGESAATDSGTPQSMAAIQMARRTDAGPRQPPYAASTSPEWKISPWLIGAAGLIVVALLLAMM
jgi:hypothetical protein